MTVRVEKHLTAANCLYTCISIAPKTLIEAPPLDQHYRAVSLRQHGFLVKILSVAHSENKKGQLSLTNPRDACETIARAVGL